MKTTSIILAALAAATTFAAAQGSLTPPPGVPGPVMKTLDQIEARTPISTAPFTITQPGSYYLTANLSVTTGNAISLDSNDVTLDLNGFTISSSSSPASGTGILIGNGLRNITITNGHIRGAVTQSGGVFSGAGFDDGIFYFSNSPANIRVSRISVSGCISDGIRLDQLDRSSTVESCVVHTVGGVGIHADVVNDCSATDCFSLGIIARVVSNSKAKSFNGSGISGEVIQNCWAIGKINGIIADHSVTNSYGESTGTNPGITTDGTASFCRGKSPSGFAIFAPIAIGCTSAGGTISSPQKHLGTP